MRAREQTGKWANFTVLAFVNFLWAAQYPAYKVASGEMESATLNFWTLLFAGSLLAPLWLLGRRPTSVRMRLGWKALRQFTILGIVGIIPPSVMLSWGIGHSSASNAAILSLTIPILMTGLGVLMLGESLTLIRILCVALGLLGTLLVSSDDLGHISLSHHLLVGNLAILMAALGSAFYNTYSKKLLSSYSELEILIFSYVVGGMACAIISIFFESKPFYHITGYSRATWLSVIVLGVLSWGLAMVLWMWVLNRLDVIQISTSIYLLPIFGLALSILATHERIGLPQLVGALITVSGTVTLTFFDRGGSVTSMQPESNL